MSKSRKCSVFSQAVSISRSSTNRDMARFVRFGDRSPSTERNRCLIFLAWASIFGYFSGFRLFHLASVHGLQGVASVPTAAVTLGSSVISAVLPLMFSACVIYCSRTELLYMLFYLEACLFSFVVSAILSVSVGSGWLYCIFLLFGRWAGAPVWITYCLRYVSGIQDFSGSAFFLCLSTLLLLSCINFCIISPYWAYLINF